MKIFAPLLAGSALERCAVDHSAGTILPGPDGAFIMKFAYVISVTNITEQIQNLIKKP